MRVITGSARGRKLSTPAGQAVRPTSALVKEAMFSAIQFEVEGARVLDLFAGSGQMGIEALSRGARECVFVENAKDSLGVLRGNLEHTGPWPGARVFAADALGWLRGYGGKPFDIALLDPPYASGLLDKTLRLLAPHMSGAGIILCETGEKTAPAEAGSFALKKQYRYGKTYVYHYRAIDS